jgi:mono/diheme cytochrome c family protein
MIVAAACGGGTPSSADADKGQPAASIVTAPADAVERGRYLTATSGCHDCHTPLKMGANGPEPDMTLALSGHPEAIKMPPAPGLPAPWVWGGAATNTAFFGPWGVTYATNLTPDEETGIGVWAEQVFVNALKTGRHMGVGRQIQPPMPWPAYSQMTDADLKAIFAYLRTVPAKKNRVPEAQLAPPPASAAPAPTPR